MSFDAEYHRTESIKRRIQSQAIAIIKRGLTAGIPERYIRINEPEFCDLLDDNFHKNKEELAKQIYQKADSYLYKFPFITIDGGKLSTRKQAGFALLFRLIACDNFGLYKDSRELVHKFQVIKSTKDENRNDIIKEIKEKDILFVSEFSYHQISKHFDHGTMFDELFNNREDSSKPTIISFTDLLTENNKIRERDIGEYLSELSGVFNTDQRVLRIRVKDA